MRSITSNLRSAKAPAVPYQAGTAGAGIGIIVGLFEGTPMYRSRRSGIDPVLAGVAEPAKAALYGGFPV